MRPRERRESGEQDLFRSRLDQIIDMNHALVKLAHTIDWRFLEERFGAVYTDKPGQPPLPTRLMAGLAILKHSYDLSDEALCDRWVENPYLHPNEKFVCRYCLLFLAGHVGNGSQPDRLTEGLRYPTPVYCYLLHVWCAKLLARLANIQRRNCSRV
jgi:transposase-like protein DUF772